MPVLAYASSLAKGKDRCACRSNEAEMRVLVEIVDTGNSPAHRVPDLGSLQLNWKTCTKPRLAPKIVC